MPCPGQHAFDLEVCVWNAQEVESVDLREKINPNKQQKHLEGQAKCSVNGLDWGM